MTREFIILPEFDRQWASMGLTDADLKALQEELTVNPSGGSVIQGTAGLRKIRISIGNKGKSKSARVCYVDFVIYEKIYLITAYPKKEKDNLSQNEKNNIKKLIHLLEHTLKEKRVEK